MVGHLFARIADTRLGNEVQSHLPRWFAEHSAQLIPNAESEYVQPRSFDHAVATVATPDLLLKLVRVRGELSIEIAVPGERPKWESLDSALTWLDIQRRTPPQTPLPGWGYGIDRHSLDWATVDGFLSENWERIKHAANERSISR